jgi:stress 70 chaperone-associated protein
VKLNLTTDTQVTVGFPLPSLNSGKSLAVLKLNITRSTFEKLNEDLFEKVLIPVKKVLEVTELEQSDIDEIVLVGGSTRIPRVRQIIKEFFNGKEPNVSIDPELAVATGVALQAGILGGAWPLHVSAIEIQNEHLKKINV